MSISKLVRNENSLLCFHIACFILINSLFLHSQAILQNQVKAKEITAQATILSKYFYDAGLAMGAYILTKNQLFGERYTKLSKQIPGAIDTLDELAKGQPEAEAKAQTIRKIALQGLDKLAKAKSTTDSGEFAPITDNQGQARNTYKQIKSVADELQLQLDQLTAYATDLSSSTSKQKSIYDILSALLLFSYATYNFIVQRKLLKTKSISSE